MKSELADIIRTMAMAVVVALAAIIILPIIFIRPSKSKL